MALSKNWLKVMQQKEQLNVLTDFGAFVEVLPGIDGLVHVSQISHKRIENPKEALTVGQEVTVKVLDVNADAERVSLSIKGS